MGAAIVNLDGTFTYTPNNGARGIDTFTYRVDDLEGGVDTETVTIIIGDTRIMPLGDSITLGTQSLGLPPAGFRIAYRQTLFEELVRLDYAIDFVGNQSEGQLTGLADTNHEGHGGINTTELIIGRTPNPNILPAPFAPFPGIFEALNNNPADVILLHIGTNDSPGSGPGPNLGLTEVQVNTLLNEIDRWETDGLNGNAVTVVVARIINQTPINPAVTMVNDAVVQMIQGRINNNGDNIIIVDQENALTYPADLADNLHPRPNGYNKMADVWLFPLAGTGTQTNTGTANQTGAHTGPGILPTCN